MRLLDKSSEAIALCKLALEIFNPPPEWAVKFLSIFTIRQPTIESNQKKLTKMFMDYETQPIDKKISTLILAYKLIPNHPWFVSNKNELLETLTQQGKTHYTSKNYKETLLLAKKTLCLDPNHPWGLEMQSTLNMESLKTVESLNSTTPWLQDLKTKIADQEKLAEKPKLRILRLRKPKT